LTPVALYLTKLSHTISVDLVTTDANNSSFFSLKGYVHMLDIIIHSSSFSFLSPPPSTKPSGNSLRLNIPRRSIALQLIESNIFTPETVAVQKLEKISQAIMEDYSDMLNSSITDLLNPIRSTDYITYDLFSRVANKVYNVASISGGTLARLAMVLNLVRETMVEGNLNETQLELLVEHSTKFFAENAAESPLKEGKGWVRTILFASLQSFSIDDTVLYELTQ